ncbi:hypothetical protein F5Y13DRAFT_14097 [Hypoxylon sp. FL1857]|nr:hypothetical protein F5Y13DRAFT_14097 [Hypoxylon sp. FL1857]
MSPKKSMSDDHDLTDRASKEDRECPDKQSQDHYDGPYTEERPPHLNNDNISSVQPNGPLAQPRGATDFSTLPETVLDSMHVTNDTEGNYTYKQYVPSTAQTDSTMRAGAPFIRPELAHIIGHDYLRLPTETGRSLTLEAIAALNGNQTQSYGGNIHDWQPPHVGNNYPTAPGNDWSTGSLTAATPMSETSTTTSSYVFVSSTYGNHSAEDVCYTGVWQSEPDTPRVPYIPDEDTRDG